MLQGADGKAEEPLLITEAHHDQRCWPEAAPADLLSRLGVGVYL